MMMTIERRIGPNSETFLYWYSTEYLVLLKSRRFYIEVIFRKESVIHSPFSSSFLLVPPSFPEQQIEGPCQVDWDQLKSREIDEGVERSKSLVSFFLKGEKRELEPTPSLPRCLTSTPPASIFFEPLACFHYFGEKFDSIRQQGRTTWALDQSLLRFCRLVRSFKATEICSFRRVSLGKS